MIATQSPKYCSVLSPRQINHEKTASVCFLITGSCPHKHSGTLRTVSEKGQNLPSPSNWNVPTDILLGYQLGCMCQVWHTDQREVGWLYPSGRGWWNAAISLCTFRLNQCNFSSDHMFKEAPLLYCTPALKATDSSVLAEGPHPDWWTRVSHDAMHKRSRGAAHGCRNTQSSGCVQTAPGSDDNTRRVIPQKLFKACHTTVLSSVSAVRRFSNMSKPGVHAWKTSHKKAFWFKCVVHISPNVDAEWIDDTLLFSIDHFISQIFAYISINSMHTL